MRQVVKIIDVGIGGLELLKVDRQAGVARISLHVNDARPRQCRANQSQKEEIGWEFVDDARRSSRQSLQQFEITSSQVAQMHLTEVELAARSRRTRERGGALVAQESELTGPEHAGTP